MDAGVPIKEPVAGVAMGLITGEDGIYKILTDIAGVEDFFGDMDFKVSGTREGITGIQLDLKTRGLSVAQVEKIFEQARVGRLQIIDLMEQTIPAPRPQISPLAPRLITIKIDPEKIGKLIGPGGKMIRGLQDKWGVTIDVEDDGTVMVAAPNGDAIEGAKAEIEALCEEIKVGTIYTGKVVSTKDFGAFIEIAAGTDGMCHISELADGFVKSVADVVRIGDMVKVKVIMIDDQGRIKLSRKAAMAAEGGAPAQPAGRGRDERGGRPG
jgi:polyribonucleotide nucleotidyltransferase